MQNNGSDGIVSERRLSWAYFKKHADPVLLAFLLLFSVDKVVLKPLAIAMGLLWIGRKFSFKDIKAAPPFYFLILVPALIKFFFFNTDFSAAHAVSFGIGTLYWLMCALAYALLHNRVNNNTIVKMEATLDAFFLLNFFVSIGNLVYAMVLSGSLNPYNIDNLDFGNSTGDYIKGIFMAPCYINMFVNALFSVYFLYRKRYAYSFLAILVACATSSNFANLVLLPVLIACIFLLKERKARLTISLQLLLYIVFYTVISPGNLAYLRSSVSARQRDAMEEQAFGKFYRGDGKLMHYCKVISMLETYEYITSSKTNLLLGAGMGAFSSQLAVRTSDLHVKTRSRLFERLPVYVAPSFRDNHYRIFEAVYSMPPGYHSIRHFPGSFVNQLLGEYGISGLLIFALFYIGFFLKRYRQLSFTIVLLIMVCGFLVFDYLFEYLSVMTFFELFFLVDLKAKTTAKDE